MTEHNLHSTNSSDNLLLKMAQHMVPPQRDNAINHNVNIIIKVDNLEESSLCIRLSSRM